VDQIDNVTAALSELTSSYVTAPVIVTGHSLGAATATLVLAYMKASGEFLIPMDRLFIYTYGQPRVGGSSFAMWYNSNFGSQHFRVVHYNDIVTHIPCCHETLRSTECMSSGDSFDPWHVMTEIYYNSSIMRNWRYCLGQPQGEDTSCSNSLSIFDYSIHNHKIYFDVPVGSMCNILMGTYSFGNYKDEVLGPYSSRARRDTLWGRNSTLLAGILSGLVCIY